MSKPNKKQKVRLEEIDFTKVFQDKDSSSVDEIEKSFSVVYKRKHELPLAKSSDIYCIDICNDSKFNNIAVTIDNKIVTLINMETMQTLLTYNPHKKKITDIKYSPEDDNIIFTSSFDGTLKLWDIRTNKCEKEFIDDTSGKRKPLSCFDVVPNNRVLCAGTDLIEEDAFLVFWDIRSDQLLGGYWQSHSDIITTVKFNIDNPHIMASGSGDGLINIFDISQESEDDALTYCLNADGVVNQLLWQAKVGKPKHLMSITDLNIIQHWDIEESSPKAKFTREDLTVAMKRKVSEECYIVSMFNNQSNGEVYILCASGQESIDDNCLRMLKYNKTNNLIEPYARFDWKSSDLMKPYALTRSGAYCPSRDIYITAGENGNICVWSNQDMMDES